MSGKMVRVLGQSVREGSKRHTILTSQVRHFNDLSAHETGMTVAKASSSVPGHLSPTQANQNMAGSAVKPPVFDTVGFLNKGVPERAYPADPPKWEHGLSRDNRMMKARKAARKQGKPFDPRKWSAADRTKGSVQRGPRGGLYRVTKNGTKVYLK